MMPMKTKLLLALIPATVLASCTSEPEKPDIIYISIEDMKPDLGCYGHPVVYSPRLDEFANDAVMFLDAHCQVALCTPSRTSILTGIRPSTSGIVTIDDPWMEMLPEAVSLPRHLRDHGYVTILAGKIHDYRCGGMDSAYVLEFGIHGVHDNRLPLQALKVAAEQQQPFFLAIGYSQVHLPWNPTEASKRYYDPDDMIVANRGKDFRGKTLTDEELRLKMRGYYACITDVDSLIGVLLDSVRAMGLYDRSIIIIGALDHGFSLGFHDHWGKGNNFDGETMVPLMIRLPGNEASGSATEGIVELVDVYPTLVDLCGLPQPHQQLEGYSLRGLLEDPGREWKKAAFTHRAYHVRDRGMKTKEYTLILREGEEPQLYDRKADPDNLVNIASMHPDMVEALTEMLASGWRNAKPE